jgi:hypothetical protein
MGVGATIAPGSHEWNGYWADLVNAPTSTSTRPTVTGVPVGGSARTRLSWNDPPPSTACPISTNPASMARPPAPVISSACRAAARALTDSWSLPMSRNDVIEVSSQKPKSRIRLSARTRPSIDPANSTSRPSSCP